MERAGAPASGSGPHPPRPSLRLRPRAQQAAGGLLGLRWTVARQRRATVQLPSSAARRQCAGAARGVAAPGPAPARRSSVSVGNGPVTPAPFSRRAKRLWLIRRLLVLPPNVERAPYTPRGREWAGACCRQRPSPQPRRPAAALRPAPPWTPSRAPAPPQWGCV